MQVKIGDFVDKWLTEIRDARAEALRQKDGSDDRLYWNKHVQDLLDQLARELVKYIEHPPGYEHNEKARITVRNGKLIVSLDGNDYNVSNERTRRARLSFVMAKILKEKGNLAQGKNSGLYDSVSDLLKPPQLAPPPDRMAANAAFVDFDTKNMPNAQEGAELRYFYDPKNVGNDLNLAKVYKTRVNLENIDQYRNANHRFGRTMSRFMNPDYRALNSSLRPRMSAEEEKKGRNRAANWVRQQNKKINAGGVDGGDVANALNKNGLVSSAAGVQNIKKAVNQPGTNTALAVALEATTPSGDAPPPEAVAAVTAQLEKVNGAPNQQNVNLFATPRGQAFLASTTANASKALANNGLKPTSTNGLNKIANAANGGTNSLKRVIKENTVNTGTKQPPAGQQLTNAAVAVQQLAGNGGAPVNSRPSNARVAGANVALRSNNLTPTSDNGLIKVANAANGGANALRKAIQKNTVNNSSNRPPNGQQVTDAAAAVQQLAGASPWKTNDPGPMPAYAVYPGNKRGNNGVTVDGSGMGAWK
jgi:hypothetical protein